MASSPHKAAAMQGQPSLQIFREYDIRGIAGDTLTVETACSIGQAFGTRVARGGKGARICVGRDGRESSPALEHALVEGLQSTGAEVLRTGLGPTPQLYFAARRLEAAGAVMVTGSHNPPQHNGFKMMLGKASLYGQDIRNLHEMITAGDFVSGAGSVSEREVQGEYIEHLAKTWKGGKSLKIAWDAGNGATGEVLAQLRQRLPATHIALNEKIDGTFPAHPPDPSKPENLTELRDTVLREQCDLGIAFDGDGDRIVAIDGEGVTLMGDQLVAILAQGVLAETPGAQVIADVKASRALFKQLEKLGGKAEMWKTGHSLIKARMAETGAALAGEVSGHIFFASNYGFDDGLYGAVRLLSLLAGSGKSLAAMRKELPLTAPSPEYRIHCAEERKFAVVDEVKQRVAAQPGVELVAIDGVRVETPEGWWLLRASNTGAELVARCEAETPAALPKLQAALAEQLRESGISFSF